MSEALRQLIGETLKNEWVPFGRSEQPRRKLAVREGFRARTTMAR